MDDTNLDPTVLVFAAGTSLVSGLFFGIVPALRSRGLRL